MTRRSLPIVVLAALLWSSCTSGGPLSRLARSPSPHDQYVEKLRDAGLDATALGRDWETAAREALQDALAANLPFRETGYFPPDVPSAAAYRVELERGRRLEVEVTLDGLQPAWVFVDLFEVRDGQEPRRVAFRAPDATMLTYEVDRDGVYVLRLQPELLRGGRYTIVERTRSTLLFPVTGLTARAVQSGFGAARDAGTREHEGVDIFAPRGTPVVAVADGMARPGENNLGGTVVWLHDMRRGRSYYYAHLDRPAIDGPTTVRAGDVVGYVGNTGNARTTAPHLHFGIYDGGAADPLPFLRPDDPEPPRPSADTALLGEAVRVVPARAPLLAGAHDGADVLGELERAWVGRVRGLSRASVRVVFPDGSAGYLRANAVARTVPPLRRTAVDPGTRLRDRPSDTASVVETVTSRLEVDVLGRFGAFDLVRTPGGRTAWLAASAAP